MYPLRAPGCMASFSPSFSFNSCAQWNHQQVQAPVMASPKKGWWGLGLRWKMWISISKLCNQWTIQSYIGRWWQNWVKGRCWDEQPMSLEIKEAAKTYSFRCTTTTRLAQCLLPVEKPLHCGFLPLGRRQIWLDIPINAPIFPRQDIVRKIPSSAQNGY